MSATRTAIDAATMNSMSQDEFGELINAWTRGELDDESRDILLGPAVIDRTCSELQAILKSVEGQIGARAADMEAGKAHFMQQKSDWQYEMRALRDEADNPDTTPERQAGILRRLAEIADELRELDTNHRAASKDFALWRGRIIRFKTGLEKDLLEAQRLRDTVKDKLYNTVVADERNRYSERIRALEDGIRAHRNHTCDIVCDTGCPADEALWKLVS